MCNFIKDENLKTLILVEGDTYFLSKNGNPKVIFDKDLTKTTDSTIYLKNQVQYSCRELDFIDCFSVLANHLLGEDGTTKIMTSTPCFQNKLLIEKGLEVMDGYVSITRDVKRLV